MKTKTTLPVALVQERNHGDAAANLAVIESRVADGALADVVWGNHDAIDQRLAGLGEVRALNEWFACWERER